MKHIQKTGAKAGQWVYCSTTPEKCRNGGSHLRDGDLLLARRLYEEQTGLKMPRIAEVPMSAVAAYQALPADKQQELSDREWPPQVLPQRKLDWNWGDITLPTNVLETLAEIATKHDLQMSRTGEITRSGLQGIHVEGLHLKGAQANIDAARPFMLAEINRAEASYAAKTERLDASIAALRKR